MLRDSVAVVPTLPRAIPLPMITMTKSIQGFLFPYIVIGLHLAAFRAAGAPLSSESVELNIKMAGELKVQSCTVKLAAEDLQCMSRACA